MGVGGFCPTPPLQSFESCESKMHCAHLYAINIVLAVAVKNCNECIICVSIREMGKVHSIFCFNRHISDLVPFLSGAKIQI